jgi:predicted nuclease of restriction endonuclease-like (RecB) superfamily
MAGAMPGSTLDPDDYADLLAQAKTAVRDARLRAHLAVSRELIGLYWQLGHLILVRQQAEGWGTRVVERLSVDLRTEFPDMKGLSRRNLLYMRAFAEAWPEIVQQPAAQLPWGAHPDPA